MRSIIKLTFQEILSKRIFLITIIMTLVFLAFYGVANHYAAEGVADSLRNMGGNSGADMIRAQVGNQIVSLGLNFSSMIVALLAILSSVGSIAGEIDNHQIDTLLARPLRRRSMVLGKFIGLGSMVAGYTIFLFIGILLINQWVGGNIAVPLDYGAAVKAGVLFALTPLPVIAAALWLSTRLSTINGGVILIVMYGVGLVGRMVEQVGNLLDNQSLINTGIISSLIFPFNVLTQKTNTLLLGSNEFSSLLGGGPLSSGSTEPSNLMLVYGAVYTILLLVGAIHHFSRRDV